MHDLFFDRHYRPIANYIGGLLATNLAGASTYHCHGNQRDGGKSYQVSAILAGEW